MLSTQRNTGSLQNRNKSCVGWMIVLVEEAREGKIRGERSEYDNQPSTRFRLFLGWNRTIIQFSIAEICTRRLHAEADGVGRLYSFFPPGPPVELFPRRSDASSWVQPALESSAAIKLISSRFRDFFLFS